MGEIACKNLARPGSFGHMHICSQRFLHTRVQCTPGHAPICTHMGMRECNTLMRVHAHSGTRGHRFDAHACMHARLGTRRFARTPGHSRVQHFYARVCTPGHAESCSHLGHARVQHVDAPACIPGHEKTCTHLGTKVQHLYICACTSGHAQICKHLDTRECNTFMRVHVHLGTQVHHDYMCSCMHIWEPTDMHTPHLGAHTPGHARYRAPRTDMPVLTYTSTCTHIDTHSIGSEWDLLALKRSGRI